MVTKVDAAYNPAENRYLVVWNGYEGAWGTPDNIFTQRLGAGGGKIGGATRQSPATKDFTSVAVHYVASVPALPPQASGNFLLAYDYDPAYGQQDGAGVYTRFLDSTGKFIGAGPVLVSPGVVGSSGNAGLSLPLELVAMQDGGYMLTLRKWGGVYPICGFLLRLNANGRAIKQIQLGKYISLYVEFIQLSKKICFVSWHREDAKYTEFFNQLYRPNLKKVKGQLKPLKGKQVPFNELVKLESDSGGYQLASDGKKLTGCYISSKGKLSKSISSLFKHNGGLDGLDAVCIPGSNTIFVAWVDKKDDHNSELKGFVFSPVTK